MSHDPPKRERSELKKRTSVPENAYEEESDWDQCSTANFNVDESAQGPWDIPAVVLSKSTICSGTAKFANLLGQADMYCAV
jgi:hypothetical protein